MKQLTLIRHAKAEPPTLNQSDFDRELNSRGLNQAAAIAQQLKRQTFTYDALFSSTAKRALTTAKTIHIELSAPNGRFIESPELYTFEPEALYRFIELIDSNLQHVVIVGHNPGLSLLLSELLRNPIANMGTCTLMTLRLAIGEWFDIQPGCAQLLTQQKPN